MKLDEVKRAFKVMSAKPEGELPTKNDFGQSMKLFNDWSDGITISQKQVDSLPDKDKQMLAKYL